MRLCLTDQIMYHVMDESSPKKIWDKLADEKFMSKTYSEVVSEAEVVWAEDAGGVRSC
jgi:hypothetical protein